MTLDPADRFRSPQPGARAAALGALSLLAAAAAAAAAPGPAGLETARTKAVPWSRSGPRRPAAVVAGQATTSPPIEPVSLLYYGGRILAQAHLVPVYWTAPDPAYRARLDAWYAAFAAGPQFDWLGEYSTAGIATWVGGTGTSQTLVHPTYSGSYVIEPGALTTVSEADIKTALVQQISAGALPAPGPETLYLFHFPPGLQLKDGSSLSCQAYCAYHDSFTSGGKTLLIGVIPSHEPPSACSGCGELDWFSNLNGSVSHEVVEAITDPDVGGLGHRACGPAWCDPGAGDDLSVHAEIGDICESGPVTEVPFSDAQHHLFVVQREWSNQHHACIGEARDAVSFQVPPYQLYKPGDVFDLPVALTAAQSGAVEVTLDVYAGVTGVSATLASRQVAAGGSTTLHVVTTGAAPARFVIGLAGETGAAQPLTTIAFGPVDFAISGAAPVQLTAGATAVVHLQSHNLSGPARSLTLAAPSMPGVTATLAGSPALGDAFDVTLAAAAGTPSGSSALHLNFSDGHLSHEVDLQLALAGDDFALVVPDKVAGVQGGDLSFTLQTQTARGNPQPLQLSGAVAGGSVRFDPAGVQSGQASKVTVHLGDGTPVGQARLTLAAAGSLVTLNQEASITVSPASGCGSAGGGSLLALLVPLLWRRRRAG